MRVQKLATALLALSLIAAAACKKSSSSSAKLYFPMVRSIIQANCITCHYPEGPGRPVDLTNDQNIANLAAAIKAATVDPAGPQNRRMPEGGELSQTDKDIIVAWFSKGGKVTD